jgi:phage terminase large subunit-like protein
MSQQPGGTPYLDFVPHEHGLYPDQGELQERAGLQVWGDQQPPAAPEIAILAEARSGASKALMYLGTRLAYEQRGARVLVLGRDLETMRANWAGRDDGIWAHTAPYCAAGAARTAPWYVGFVNRNSRLQFREFRDARQVPDATHALIDDADEMSVELWRGLRDKVLSRPPLPGEHPQAVRLVTVARLGGGGWPAMELRAAEGERVVMEFRGRGMPAKLRAPAAPREAIEPISLRDYIQMVEPRYRFHYHSELLIYFAQLALDREFDVGLVSVPPGYGKSWVVSAALPSCELYLRRQNQALVVAATDPLAANHTYRARLWFRAAGGVIAKDRDSRHRWGPIEGGQYEAVGRRSAILSLRGDMIVYDDPHGSLIEAGRRTEQQQAYQTWEELETRVQRFGHRPAVRLLMHQRLDRFDVLGRALDEEREKASGDRIVYLNLAAIKRRTYIDVPATVISLQELDSRQEGEALCEEIQSLEKLQRIEERGPVRFLTIYQGDPPLLGAGDMFSRGHLVELDEMPPLSAFQMIVRSWDLAASESKKADGTASILLGLLVEPIIVEKGKPVWWVVLHATNDRIEAPGVYAKIKAVAVGDGYGMPVLLPKDPGAGGKILWSVWSSQLAMEGFPVDLGDGGGQAGGKRMRAYPLSGAMDPGRDSGLETGSVAIVRQRRGKAKEDMDELTYQLDAFTGQDDEKAEKGLDLAGEASGPQKVHDDLVDALTQAFNYIARICGWSP